MQIKNSAPWFSEETKNLFLLHSKDILDSGILISGKYTALLEDEARKVTSTRYAVALSSGTAALEIILKNINCKDFEVLLPNNTFISTLYAIQNAQGKPVLVDINPTNFCIDINDLIKKINNKSKVLILVHLAGYITEDIEEIKKLCNDKNLILVEDSSHAFGAKYKNHIAGNIGFASALSLYPTKIITGATGGIITTNNFSLYEYSCIARSHGNDEFGLNHLLSPNWYISEFNALLCYLQVKQIDEIIEKRSKIANTYNKAIKSKFQHLNVQPIDYQRVHPYYKYIVRTSFDCRKKDIFSLFDKCNISLGQCYGTQLSEHPSIKNLYYKNRSTLKKSLEFASHHFTLPCHMNLSEEEIQKILNILEQSFN